MVGKSETGISPITSAYANRPQSRGGGQKRVYVTYGPSNRTQMIRIPAPGRIENRVVDGAANPYLASAAILGAGLDGIEHKMDPGIANTTNLYEAPEDELARRGINFLPTTLREALDCLEKGRIIREALGSEFASYYIAVKAEECRQYHQSVSEWERDKYLMTF